MSYKTILVHVDLTDDMLVRAETAVTLARQFDAEIMGSAGGLPPTPALVDSSGLVIASIVEFEQDQIAAELGRASEKFLTACRTVFHTNCRIAVRDPTVLLLNQASSSDLIIVTRQHETDAADPAMALCLGRAILAAGRPVLCLPPGRRQRDFDRILIAWKDTREARRAVSDALPLLRKAELVTVATIDEDADEGLDDVVMYLKRHGLSARAVRCRRRDETVVDALSTIADDGGYGLIVAGAYGHSRMRELMFGGVTRDLLTTSTVPVLLSH